jgi:uncharacterized RDD family membrane protein YckC
MKCPNCGFNSFDYLSACKRCGNPLEPNPMSKAIYESITEAGKQKGAEVNESAIEKPVSVAVLPTSDLSHIETRSGIWNDPHIRSISTETFASVKDEENKALNLSIPSDFLPYRLSSAESQQEKGMTSFDFAGIGSRAKAFIIDLILVFGSATLTLGFGLFFIGAGFSVDRGRIMDVLIPIYVVLLFLGSTYFVFLEGFTGKTIGKMILGIRIIRDDGESMRLWEAFVRWLGYYVSAFFIFMGFIWAIFDSKNQAWHDKFAGTYVIKG